MILAFDIGGTKIAVGLVEGDKILNYQKILWSKPLTKEKFLKKIITIIQDYKSKIKNCTAVALGVAGQVNFKEGSVVLSPNLSKKREKIFLKKILEQKFKWPIFVDNDANCFTLGEAVFGQGKNEKFVIGLTVGTGIGGGIVIDKKILRGKDGFTGEFGHQLIEIGGRHCLCGQRGCLEAYASGRAMAEFYFQITGQQKNTFQIKKEFAQKKSNAVFVVNETARWLKIGLANLINILNPDLIVLGGGMVGFQSFTKIALKNLRPWLLVPKVKTKILISQLREKAGLLGAALLTNHYDLLS
ncbi:MAG: ROK family protein [Patescibacteria group bacterium]|nr:ROK family protein [Patescibacteria group bacterium]